MGDFIGRKPGKISGESNFKRVIEDFECGLCGTVVKGKGYTNHCPECLWSKHVDVNPGDRADDCEGLMKPKSSLYDRGGNFTIIHECLKCGRTKRVKAAENDNRELLSKLQKSGPLIIE
jgi:hypothetical protein